MSEGVVVGVNGRAWAPPASRCRTGVSTSTKPRSVERPADRGDDGVAHLEHPPGLVVHDRGRRSAGGSGCRRRTGPSTCRAAAAAALASSSNRVDLHRQLALAGRHDGALDARPSHRGRGRRRPRIASSPATARDTNSWTSPSRSRMRGEGQLALAPEQHAPARRPAPRSSVSVPGGRSPWRGSQLAERVGAVEAVGVGLDAVGPEGVELGQASGALLAEAAQSVRPGRRRPAVVRLRARVGPVSHPPRYRAAPLVTATFRGVHGRGRARWLGWPDASPGPSGAARGGTRCRRWLGHPGGYPERRPPAAATAQRTRAMLGGGLTASAEAAPPAPVDGRRQRVRLTRPRRRRRQSGAHRGSPGWRRAALVAESATLGARAHAGGARRSCRAAAAGYRWRHGDQCRADRRRRADHEPRRGCRRSPAARW